MKELNIQRLIQLAASDAGILTFRNNSGAYVSDAGHRISYGVGSPGGSDLIGITPVVITSDMVGKTLGVFTAIEVKTPKGRPTPAQLNFIEVIKKNGGYAGICRSPEELTKIIKP